MNLFKFIRHPIYLLQLENYDLPRFWLAVWRWRGRVAGPARQKLVMTAKLVVVAALAAGLALLAAIAIGGAWWPGARFWIIAIFALLVFYFAFAIFLTLAVLLLWPVDIVLKKSLVEIARNRLRRFPSLKIIGITGSYGKTTLKEAIAAVLGRKFVVLSTPENINTPLGIARLILRHLTPQTQILVIEMGAYHVGDIKAICRLTQPNIAILTGINEAHLERFGKLKNTIRAKFEIVDSAAPDALIFLNGDNELVKNNSRDHLAGRRAIFYGAAGAGGIATENFQFFEDGSGVAFSLTDRGRPFVRLTLPVLGTYILGVASCAAAVGRALGLTDWEIQKGLETLKSIPHRLQVIPTQNQILVIDDSYNGNPDGAHEAIAVLKKFSSRRKIYITPGLVETGTRAQEIHEYLGSELAGAADSVILIKNSVTPFIAAGLKRGGFADEQIKWFPTAPAAHAALPDLLRAGDVVLFQNDWADNYF